MSRLLLPRQLLPSSNVLVTSAQEKFANICSLRNFSIAPIRFFKFSQLEIKECSPSERSAKPDWNKLVFGHHFNDHMFEVSWHHQKGWGTPKICPLHPFTLHPAAKVLHYAQELFEGMKAFRGDDNKIRLFRPDKNMERMRRSAERISLPDFDGEELLACMKKLIQIDADWVPPAGSQSSLYIRPTFIGTEPTLGVLSSKEAVLYIICGPVGSYFATGVKPVHLLADPAFVRAWPGGCGNNKLGSNYGPTVAIQKIAEKKGMQQVLWLYGEDHQLTEVGTMNIFFFFVNDNGQKELVTPPLDQGIILPGVIRLSLLELARSWNEFKVTERTINMKEIQKLLKEKRLLEVFGAGTACVVCPVDKITYNNEVLNIPTMEHKEPLNLRFLKELTDIQYGKTPHKWSVPID